MGIVNVLALLFTTAIITQACDLDSIQSCMKLVTSEYPMATNAFSYHGLDQDRVCGLLKKTEKCVLPHLEFSCPVEYRAVWDVFNSTLSYACSDYSREVLRNAQPCVQSDSASQDLLRCQETLTRTLQSIQTYGGATSELCSAEKTYASCAMTVIRAHCDASLTTWYAGFLDAALKPANKLTHCYFHAGRFPLGHIEAIKPKTTDNRPLRTTTNYPSIAYEWKYTCGAGFTKYSPVVLTFAVIVSVFYMN